MTTSLLYYYVEYDPRNVPDNISLDFKIKFEEEQMKMLIEEMEGVKCY